MKKNLFIAAKEAKKRSYSPYSGYKIGASILTSTGHIFSGCNVENASYGGTVCAERTALLKAISEVGKCEVLEICVISDAKKPWPPCGLCRQVLAEFAKPNTKIYLANNKGVQKTFLFKDIFPETFSKFHLKRKS